MLEGFSLVSSVVFYIYFFKDPIEALSKFPQDSKPQGGDDSNSQHAQARQEGFSRLVHLSAKFALIILPVIQAPARKFSLSLFTYECTELFSGPLRECSPAQFCFTPTKVWFPELTAYRCTQQSETLHVPHKPYKQFFGGPSHF